MTISEAGNMATASPLFLIGPSVHTGIQLQTLPLVLAFLMGTLVYIHVHVRAGQYVVM